MSKSDGSSKAVSTEATPSRREADLAEWYAAQYLASVGLDRVEGGAKFKRFVTTLPVVDSVEGFAMTGRIRMPNFLKLRLRYPLGPAGYACLVLSAEAGGASAHYAYTYWRRGQEAAPEYICVSPTFDSRDGEYRRRFIRYATFAAAYEQLASALEPFEAAVLRLTAAGKLALKATVFPEELASEISDKAHELRIMVLAFAAALAQDLWEILHKITMVHANPEYVALMAFIGQEEAELSKQSHDFFSLPEHDLLVRGEDDLFAVQCGQKLVPLSEREAMQPFDYNLSGWRELAVTRLVGDLVLNFISPSFSLYDQFTYIEGAGAGLFENAPMEERYVRSLVAGRAATSLRDARRTLDSEENPNYYTGELSAKIYESLEYAQSFLLMSQVAIMHTMEDVGWSLRSLEVFARRAPTQWPAASGAFASLDSAARLIFEPVYAAHCLHSKLGVAHTDIHGNNLTFYMWGLAHQQRIAKDTGLLEYVPYYENPVVLYVAGSRGEADSYLFPAAGSSCCIIDYSRCVIGPAFRPRLEAGRSPQYATHFYRDQVNRVMRTLHRYAPNFVAKNEAAIKASVLANFDAAFPVLCAVDFVAIGRSIKSALADAAMSAAEGDLREFSIAPEAIALASRLETAAFDRLIVGLQDLAESAGSRRLLAPPALPGTALIKNLFAPWSFQRWATHRSAQFRSAQLVDCWNYQNDLKYSGEDYALWPSWARLDEIERHLGELKLTDLFEQGAEPFLEALRPGARVEIIAERLRAENERLDGEPVSTASSWLED